MAAGIVTKAQAEKSETRAPETVAATGGKKTRNQGTKNVGKMETNWEIKGKMDYWTDDKCEVRSKHEINIGRELGKTGKLIYMWWFMQQTLWFERIGKHWDLRGLKGEMAVCGWNSKIVFYIEWIIKQIYDYMCKYNVLWCILIWRNPSVQDNYIRYLEYFRIRRVHQVRGMRHDTIILSNDLSENDGIE